MSLKKVTQNHELQDTLRENIFHVFLQICSFLHDIHGLGYSHNDIKLDNVMVDIKNTTLDVFVIDYGSMCRFGKRTFGEIACTHKYASENTTKGLIKPSGDVYSVIICILECMEHLDIVVDSLSETLKEMAERCNSDNNPPDVNELMDYFKSPEAKELLERSMH